MFLKLIKKFIFDKFKVKVPDSPQAELIKIIAQIQSLLSLYSDEKTQYWDRYFNTINRQLKSLHDIKNIAKKMMLIFEDPDNFDDLVLYKEGKQSKKDNKRLQQLRIELCKWSEDFLDGSHSWKHVCAELESRVHGKEMVEVVRLTQLILNVKEGYYCSEWDNFYNAIFKRSMIGYGCKDVCLLVMEVLGWRDKNFDEFILPKHHNLLPQKIYEFNHLHEQLCILCHNTLQVIELEELGIVPLVDKHD